MSYYQYNGPFTLPDTETKIDKMCTEPNGNFLRILFCALYRFRK